MAEQTSAPSAMAGSQTGAAASQTGVPSSRTGSPERIRGRIWGDDIDPQVANSMLGNWPQYHREQVLPGHSASDWPKNQPRGEAVVQGSFDADSSADQAAPHRAVDYAMPSGNESDGQLVPLMVSGTVYAGEMWTPQGNDNTDANLSDAFADSATVNGANSGSNGGVDGNREQGNGISTTAHQSAVALNSSNYLANDETAEETIADETTTADAMSGYAPSGNAIAPSVTRDGQATYGIDPRIGSASAIGTHEDALPNGTSANDTALMRSGDAAALRIDAHYRLSHLPADYHVFNDVSLPLEGRTLDFDQLVISTSGVFIVSFMPLDGSVYGDGRSPNWAVVPYGSPVTPDEARACAQGVAAAVPQGLQLIANPARRNEWLVDGTARMMGLPADVFHCAVLVPPTARLYLDNAGLAITPTQETGWILSTTPSVLEAEYVADLANALDEYLNG
ncbi:nuclease-related domain-containing protein [Pseudoscardovia suis]|nr:nuclease-related domain-containing protein [Pseudoscardovia suis]